MWEPRRLTTLLEFMACYRDGFTFYLYHSIVTLKSSSLFFKTWVRLLPTPNFYPHIRHTLCFFFSTTTSTVLNFPLSDFAFFATCRMQWPLHSPTFPQSIQCSDFLGVDKQAVWYRRFLVANCFGMHFLYVILRYFEYVWVGFETK
jgi:hypothetical protein